MRTWTEEVRGEREDVDRGTWVANAMGWGGRESDGMGCRKRVGASSWDLPARL